MIMLPQAAIFGSKGNDAPVEDSGYGYRTVNYSSGSRRGSSGIISDPVSGSFRVYDPGHDLLNPARDLTYASGEFTDHASSSAQELENPSQPVGIDYSFAEYLEGLLSSVGAEAETDRLFNSAEAQKNRDFQAEQAQINRDWETAMSNSAYTRAVADLKNAGLNPILAAGGSAASTPTVGVSSGSSASHSTAGGDTASSIIQAIGSLVNGAISSAAKIAGLFI